MSFFFVWFSMEELHLYCTMLHVYELIQSNELKVFVLAN